MIHPALLVLVGVTAGLIGGLLGLGGGILLMPFFRFVVGLPAPLAAGTCITCVFFTTLAGSHRHFKLGHIHFRSLLPVIVAGVISTAVFSLVFMVGAEKNGWLDVGIGLVFLCVAARMMHAALRRRRGSEEFDPSMNRLEGTVVQKSVIGILAGALPGLLGIGTGAVLVPAFTMILDAQIKVAIGSSLACFAGNALVSALFKLEGGYVDLSLAVPVGLGAVLGANLGARLSKRVPSEWLRLLFGIVFSYIALKFLLSAWGVRI